MRDRHIGDVRVTRIEGRWGRTFRPGFLPEFNADAFQAEQHWLAPSYYQPERPADDLDPFLAAADGKHTILVDACSGNHKPRPGMPRFDMLDTVSRGLRDHAGPRACRREQPDLSQARLAP